jgi:hypothetical protein
MTRAASLSAYQAMDLPVVGRLTSMINIAATSKIRVNASP